MQPALFSQLVVVPLFTEHRILSQVAGHGLNVIKGLPPLVLAEEDVDWFVTALEAALAEAQESRRPRRSSRSGCARPGRFVARPPFGVRHRRVSQRSRGAQRNQRRAASAPATPHAAITATAVPFCQISSFFRSTSRVSSMKYVSGRTAAIASTTGGKAWKRRTTPR